jgi:hypothetical protein
MRLRAYLVRKIPGEKNPMARFIMNHTEGLTEVTAACGDQAISSDFVEMKGYFLFLLVPYRL